MEPVDLDGLDLPELTCILELLEGCKTVVGWLRDDEALRSEVERRIMDVITNKATEEGRGRARWVPCRLPVLLCLDAASVSVPSHVSKVGPGGVFVATAKNLPEGSMVVLEVCGESDEHGLRALGKVTRREQEGDANEVSISFCDTNVPAIRHRLLRFILEALRHREEL